MYHTLQNTSKPPPVPSTRRPSQWDTTVPNTRRFRSLSEDSPMQVAGFTNTRPLVFGSGRDDPPAKAAFKWQFVREQVWFPLHYSYVWPRKSFIQQYNTHLWNKWGLYNRGWHRCWWVHEMCPFHGWFSNCSSSVVVNVPLFLLLGFAKSRRWSLSVKLQLFFLNK